MPSGDFRNLHADTPIFTLHFNEIKTMKALAKPIQAILCRSEVSAPETSNSEIMFMPGGMQKISPVSGGSVVGPITVKVDRAAAVELNKQHAEITARGKRPYFDFNHEDGPASFWPRSYAWRETPQAGVYALGEWSAGGKSAVDGKSYRQFSPVFYVDKKTGTSEHNPARIICVEGARANMGGLVNDPAFHDILPLWAKDGDDGDGENETDEVSQRPEKGGAKKSKEKHAADIKNSIAKIKGHLGDLQDSLAEVMAREGDTATLEAQISAAQAELRAMQLEKRLCQLEETSNQLAEEKEIKARQLADERRKGNEEKANAAIEDAVSRFVIPPRATPLIAKWREVLTADPSAVMCLSGLPGMEYLRHRITASTVGSAIAAKAGVSVVASDPRDIFGKLGALCAKQLQVSMTAEKAELAKEYGVIYAREFRGEQGMRLLDSPLVASDNTDGNLGTLAGSLVTMRALELLKFQFPGLTRFSTDFSDMPAMFNQTIITRIVNIPSCEDYDPTNGWADSTANTVDVPVTINKHKGVPITFNSNTLGSTVRALFSEFGPAQSYALGKQMIEDLYANITDAKFTNNTVQATGGFGRQSVIDIGTELTLRAVPQGEEFRTMLLWPTLFANLSKDADLVRFAAFQRAPMFEDGRKDRSTAFAFPVHGFEVHEAPDLPTNNGNITGFAGSKSALVISTRVPNDYTSVLPGSSFGNVMMVTNPDIGITVMLVQYVDHKKGSATQRIAIMYGTAPGQTVAGQLIKSAVGAGSGR